MIKHPQVYEITMEIYVDEDEQAKSIRRLVTIPDTTLQRLADDRQYPFYLFYDEDGMELILRYDAILEVNRVIQGND